MVEVEALSPLYERRWCIFSRSENFFRDHWLEPPSRVSGEGEGPDRERAFVPDALDTGVSGSGPFNRLSAPPSAIAAVRSTDRDHTPARFPEEAVRRIGRRVCARPTRHRRRLLHERHRMPRQPPTRQLLQLAQALQSLLPLLLHPLPALSHRDLDRLRRRAHTGPLIDRRLPAPCARPRTRPAAVAQALLEHRPRARARSAPADAYLPHVVRRLGRERCREEVRCLVRVRARERRGALLWCSVLPAGQPLLWRVHWAATSARETFEEREETY